MPTSSPPTITMPICCRLSPPAPLAMARGTEPSTMAPVVMRIGRRRFTEASSTASCSSIPWRSSWLANSTMRMPCLVISPISVTMPTCE
ncbi:hypothetical protein D3C81_1910710 [compost metagenome]